ncbi:MAG: hypothetical protein ACFCBW_13900 [Candidatus Competibacterales bacterium]
MPGLRASVVAINGLPPGPETRILRLLGRGRVQRQAMAEVAQTPDEALHGELLRCIGAWRVIAANLPEAQRTLESEELVMNIDEAFAEYQRQLIKKGMQQGMDKGLRQGRVDVLVPLLKGRFGELSDNAPL